MVVLQDTASELSIFNCGDLLIGVQTIYQVLKLINRDGIRMGGSVLYVHVVLSLVL